MYLAVIKVPYVGMKVATDEKIAATDSALTRALLLPNRSPRIPQDKEPIAKASNVMETAKESNYIHFFC